MLPESGGQYNYIRSGFGNFFGFLFIWTRYLILRPADAAVNSLSFATYLAEQFFPQECSNAETNANEELVIKLFASLTLILIALLNSVLEVKWIIRLSNLMSS